MTTIPAFIKGAERQNHLDFSRLQSIRDDLYQELFQIALSFLENEGETNIKSFLGSLKSEKPRDYEKIVSIALSACPYNGRIWATRSNCLSLESFIRSHADSINNIGSFLSDNSEDIKLWNKTYQRWIKDQRNVLHHDGIPKNAFLPMTDGNIGIRDQDWSQPTDEATQPLYTPHDFEHIVFSRYVRSLSEPREMLCDFDIDGASKIDFWTEGHEFFNPAYGNNQVLFSVLPKLYDYHSILINNHLNYGKASLGQCNDFLAARLFNYYMAKPNEAGVTPDKPIHPAQAVHCLWIAFSEFHTSRYPHIINTHVRGSELLDQGYAERLLTLASHVGLDNTIDPLCLTSHERTTLLSQDPTATRAAIMVADYLLENWPEDAHESWRNILLYSRDTVQKNCFTTSPSPTPISQYLISQLFESSSIGQ
jgi:hypothetical protein